MEPQRMPVVSQAALAISLHSAALLSADLAYVAARVAKDHPDWSQNRIDAALNEYREYLIYISANRHEHVLPPLDADEVWHAHLLHTREYAAFCQVHFGQFLHHVPNPNPTMNLKRFGNLSADCTAGSSCAWWTPEDVPDQVN